MVVADDGHIFELRLSDQHPIEWIAMLSRQSSGTLCVQHGDVERRESLPSNAPGHVGGHIERPRQLAEPSFGRDFPGRCRTDQNGVRLVTYRTPRFERQTTVAVEPPEQRMCVEQQSHSAPALGFFEGQRLEKRSRNLRSSAHGTETALRTPGTKPRQPRDRRSASRNNHFLAVFGALDET